MAASVLALGGAAHAGGSDGYYGGGWSSAPPCGCQGGYGDESSGGWSYSYESPYVDEDDFYEGGYGYRGDYVPFEAPAYGADQDWRYGEGYEHRDYDYDYDRGYGGSYHARPRYRSYGHAYRAPRTYLYRSYHYSAPTYRRSYGHSSTDGERG